MYTSSLKKVHELFQVQLFVTEFKSGSINIVKMVRKVLKIFKLLISLNVKMSM